MRPLLLPHLRRLWRDGHTLQLGTDPRLAAVFDLPAPVTGRVLELLDGTRTVPSVLAAAAQLGVPAVDVHAILDGLRRAGFLTDVRALLPRGLTPAASERLIREAGALALDALADRRTGSRPAAGPTAGPGSTPGPGTTAGPGNTAGPRSPSAAAVDRTPAEALRRRVAARVLVAGQAWLGAPIAAMLAAAGVGGLDPALDGWTVPGDAMVGGLLPTDTDRSRASAAADAVRRAGPDTRVASLRAGGATFLVRVGSRPATALATRGVRQRATPRLDVHLRDGIVVVGPLVLPSGSPCGQCLELHRRDRDPAWPVIAAQLATGRQGTEPCAVTTAVAGAAYAVDEVLRCIDGRPVRTHGATVEVAGAGSVRRRSWPAHPGCDCSRRRRTAPVRQLPPTPSNNGS